MLVFIRVLLCFLIGINLSAQISLKIICSDNPKAIKKLKYKSTIISNEDIKQENTNIISQLLIMKPLVIFLLGININGQN
jgi:hypothetical protein